MHVERPRGHDAVIHRLWRAAQTGRMPHALSFEGREGIGKFLAAKWFAQGLLCEQGPGEPCGSCGPCKRVLSGGPRGNHPDLFLIDPTEEGEETIRVHRIAHRPDATGKDDAAGCIEAFLDLRAFEGRGRIVILREAERMNTAAQNALLKTLEEPRPGTHIVLETRDGGLLLPTIKSRCVRVAFDSLSRDDCVAVLTAQGLDLAEAGEVARWSEGSPGRALADRARGFAAMRTLFSQVLLAQRPPLAVAREVAELEAEFRGSTPTARVRDRARVFLDLCALGLRDLVALRAGIAAESLSQGELVQRAAAVWSERTESELAQLVTVVLNCRANVDRNVTPDALIERACLASSPAVRSNDAPASPSLVR